MSGVVKLYFDVIGETERPGVSGFKQHLLDSILEAQHLPQDVIQVEHSTMRSSDVTMG
jgi:diketogulonate reductase-like aldo/keto reductase